MLCSYVIKCVPHTHGASEPASVPYTLHLYGTPVTHPRLLARVRACVFGRACVRAHAHTLPPNGMRLRTAHARTHAPYARARVLCGHYAHAQTHAHTTHARTFAHMMRDDARCTKPKHNATPSHPVTSPIMRRALVWLAVIMNS